MSKLKLTVLSLRYSSWSMRPWLVLYHTGAPFETETVALPHMDRQSETTSLAQRRSLGSVRGLFPVLRVGDTPIHEIRLPWSMRRTLHSAGLITIGDVREATNETLLGLKLNSGAVDFIRATLG